MNTQPDSPSTFSSLAPHHAAFRPVAEWPSRLRVGVAQFPMSPAESLQAFRAQLEHQVAVAADAGCELLVLPEYLSLPLLALGDVRAPMPEQLRGLAAHSGAVVEAVGQAAQRYGLHVLAGSLPELAAFEGSANSGERPAAGRNALAGPCLLNVATWCTPTGEFAQQAKLQLTRWEEEQWGLSAGRGLVVLDTPLGPAAIAICYDVEFPELVRAAARLGCELLLVPSYTDDPTGYWRVRLCAQARAIENQLYVLQATTCGTLPGFPWASQHWGRAGIYTPSDFGFAREGVAAIGEANVPHLVVAELDMTRLREARADGTVRPLRDAQRIPSVLTPTHCLRLG